MSQTGKILATYATANGLGERFANGPDGDIYFLAYSSPTAVVEKSTMTGNITPYSLQSGADPLDILLGPDHNLWISENGTSSLAKLTVGGQLTEYTVGFSAAPGAMTVGPDGNIWVVEGSANQPYLHEVAGTLIGKFVY